MQIKENPLGLAFLVENWRALLEPLVLELHHLKSFCQTLNRSLCHLILSTLLTLNFFLLKTRVNMISLSLSFLIGIRISSSKSMYLFLIKSVIWSMHTPWSALLWGPFIQGPDTDVVAVVVEGQGLSTNLRVCPHLLHYLPALFCAVF